MKKEYLHATEIEIQMQRWMCGVTTVDKIRKEFVRGNLKLVPGQKRLAWQGHVMRKDENYGAYRMIMHRDLEEETERQKKRQSWME